MKKLLVFLFVIFIFLSTSFNAKAVDLDELSKQYGVGELYDSLPEDSRRNLYDMGITGVNISELRDISFEKILGVFADSAADNLAYPLKIFASLVALMLLYSLVQGLKTTSEGTMNGVLSLCATLCVTCIAVVPVISLIDNSASVIKTMADFMQTFIPVVTVIVIASGRPASGSAYYGFTIGVCQVIVKVFSDFVVPFLKILLSLSITSSVSSGVNLGGIVRSISKFSKWILGFFMTMFTAVLSIKQLLASGSDKLSERAAKFALSGSVPVVGSALSEAYKSVQGSLGVLKSGVGVFAVVAVFSVAAVPVVSCLSWMICLSAAKSVGELLGLKEPCALLESVSGVVGLFFAILICCVCMFLISSALVLLIGGAQ